jgi:hypothetical protein
MSDINIEKVIASKASNIRTKLSLGYELKGNETLTLSEAKAAIKEMDKLTEVPITKNYKAKSLKGLSRKLRFTRKSAELRASKIVIS